MSSDLKWFIKEVRSIYVRNLNAEGDILSEIPSPSLEIYASQSDEGQVLLFTGSPVTRTCNPSWMTSALKSLNKPFNYLSCKELLIKLCDSNGASSSSGGVLLSYTVNLARIVRLGNIHLTKISKLPINAVFLSTDSGFYITETLFEKLRDLEVLPMPGRAIDDDDSEEFRPVMLTEQMNASNERIAGYRGQLEGVVGTLEKSKKHIEIETKRAELARLEAELSQVEAEADEEERQEEAERAQLKLTRNLRKEVKSCEELVENISELNNNCKAQKADLLKLQFLFESRQLKLLSDLQQVYPIERTDGGEYSIRGIELHLDSTRDEEVVSTGLGYVVHLLLLVSKYLEVPLRYQLLFYASRSMIRDPIAVTVPYNTAAVSSAAQAGVTLPLYRRGNERERFEQAVQWLRSDVEQLLQTRGVPYVPRQSLLYNINQLFSCEMCPTVAA
jgi:hypothetical protein